MRIKLELFLIIVSTAVLLTPNLVRAQDTADAFAKYTNPHSICDYYRTIGNFVVERESDNECLVSLGTGKNKGFTQYYYSGNNWCYKLYSGSEVVSSACVQRPDKSIDFTKYEPYIVVGVIVLVFAITISSISGNKPPINTKQPAAERTPSYSQPKSVRSKVSKPKKRGRIWPELSRWLKFGRKK